MIRTYIIFLECQVRGNWTETTDVGRTSRDCTAQDDNAEVGLVRQDGLRRNFIFKRGAVVSITPMMLGLENDDVVNELTVDEDGQAGKQPRPKLGVT
jgi:hypothetical protein